MVPLTGTSPILSHILSNNWVLPLRYLSSSTNAGTISIESKNVTKIPIKSVIPTVLIGWIGTKKVQVKTLKPIIVVIADSIIALPVVKAALTVAVKLITGSQGLMVSEFNPSRFASQAFSNFSSISSTLFSSILFVKCKA